MTAKRPTENHAKEAQRIQKELDSLGDEFLDDGIVKTVLRLRIEQEKQRAKAKKAKPPK
jgi:hypothetical protein